MRPDPDAGNGPAAGRTSRRLFLLGVMGVAIAGAVPLLLRRWRGRSGFSEAFTGALDGAWIETASGDFSERRIRIAAGRGLEIVLGTEGTNDASVKHAGVRRRESLPWGRGGRLAVTIDWNGQSNGSYLGASLVVSPHASLENPLDTPDWLQVGYVGVPPGENARLVLVKQERGARKTLFNEGWPDRNRAGRAIARQRLELRQDGNALELFENGTSVFAARGQALTAENLWVYLQVSSHSNYRPRSIVFGAAMGEPA